MTHRKIVILLGMVLALLVSATASMAQEVERPDGWSEESHGNDADLNYEVVFPQDAVNTINITIAPETWAAMLEDMTHLYGEFGSREGQGGPGGPGMVRELPEGFEPPAGQ